MQPSCGTVSVVVNAVDSGRHPCVGMVVGRSGLGSRMSTRTWDDPGCDMLVMEHRTQRVTFSELLKRPSRYDLVEVMCRRSRCHHDVVAAWQAVATTRRWPSGGQYDKKVTTLIGVCITGKHSQQSTRCSNFVEPAFGCCFYPCQCLRPLWSNRILCGEDHWCCWGRARCHCVREDPVERIGV